LFYFILSFTYAYFDANESYIPIFLRTVCSISMWQYRYYETKQYIQIIAFK